jgi:hypothetical protein
MVATGDTSFKVPLDSKVPAIPLENISSAALALLLWGKSGPRRALGVGVAQAKFAMMVEYLRRRRHRQTASCTVGVGGVGSRAYLGVFGEEDIGTPPGEMLPPKRFVELVLTPSPAGDWRVDFDLHTVGNQQEEYSPKHAEGS